MKDFHGRHILLAGPHQVAQKVRRITLPLKSFNSTFCPPNSPKRSWKLFLLLYRLEPCFEKRSSGLAGAAR